MSESEKNSSSSAFIRLLGYARPHRKRMIAGIAAGILVGGSVFGLLSNLQGLFQPITGQSAPVAEERAHNNTLGSGGAFLERLGIPTVTDDGRMTWQLMVLSVIGLPLFVTLRAGATFVNRYFMRWVGARVVADIRNKMFEHLQAQSLAFFGKSDVGKLISRVTNDTGQVENLLATTVSDATRAPFEILSAATFAIMFAHRNGLLPLLLCVFLVFPLCVLPIAVLGRRVKRHTAEALSRISVVVSRMHENFTGIRVVKAFDMEREEQERFASINSGYFMSSIRALRAELLMTPLMEAVAILLSMVFIVICYVRGVGMSLVLPVSVACVVAYKPVKQLARVNADLQRAAASLGRIFELLDEDTQLSISPDAVDVREFKDSVVFDHVSFRYDVDGGEALSGIDLTIRRGDIIAFVGETGSGKTTVANLLARFYDPSQGSVRLDGIDLREINPRSLRHLIGVVTQETILFNDTIAANISYGTAGATRAQIETAARQANAHEFIMDSPLGYDRVVGEKGFVLSGGERQRIAIARAILKNPPILILDEATSALDTVTERLVQEAISRVMENRTVFAIAHRLSTIRHASHICLLDNGRIVERGTHDELYAAKGRYRNLCDIQFNE